MHLHRTPKGPTSYTVLIAGHQQPIGSYTAEQLCTSGCIPPAEVRSLLLQQTSPLAEEVGIDGFTRCANPNCSLRA